MDSQSFRRSIVVFAGTGINLALGVLYSWSLVAKALTANEWGWSAAAASLPYSVAIGTFALTMVFAGRAQDKIGPRWVATLGGALTGIGFIVSSLVSRTSAWVLVLGFGLLAGAGIGLGYASTTPPAVKWFHPSRKGLVTGIVVAGFGLASVYISPVTNELLAAVGVNRTLLTLGVAFLLVTVSLSQLLRNPPAGYIAAAPARATAKPAAANEYDWRQMVRTPQFALLWIMFAAASFAGLMIIGHLAKIAAQQLPGVNLGFVLVATLALFNAGGRVGAGVLSDKIGRVQTMMLVFGLQAVVLTLFGTLTSVPLLLVGSALVGINYGANLSLFPATTADYFGTKNLGVNYGLVFTAWGIGGVFGGMVAGGIVDATGSYQIAFYVAAALCLLAVLASLVLRALSAPAALPLASRPVSSS